MARTEKNGSRNLEIDGGGKRRRIEAVGIKQLNGSTGQREEAFVGPASISATSAFKIGEKACCRKTLMGKKPEIVSEDAERVTRNALEVLDAGDFAPADEEAALREIRRWKRGRFMGIRRLRGLATGMVNPEREEIIAIYAAAAATNNPKVKGYLIGVLMEAAVPTESSNPEIVRMAKECVEKFEKGILV